MIYNRSIFLVFLWFFLVFFVLLVKSEKQVTLRLYLTDDDKNEDGIYDNFTRFGRSKCSRISSSIVVVTEVD